jgi:hypothetical protein
MEELHAQVVRLKRQRDRLTRDQQELSRALAEAQEAAALARQEAAAAKVRSRALVYALLGSSGSAHFHYRAVVIQSRPVHMCARCTNNTSCGSHAAMSAQVH